MRTSIFTLAILTATLAACGAQETADDASGEASIPSASTDAPQQANATLYDADGNEVGVAIAMEREEGVSMNIMADGVLPGSHGAHIHETGKCEPDFMASGEHWGPFDAALGLADDDPSNDSENAVIEVGEDGTGELAYDLGGEVTFAGILEGDGSAFVLHQRNVEPTADTPSGEGDRIACGVFSSGS